MDNKTALIFGCTGMDGSHLSDMLCDKGYNVIGVKRRSSTNTTQNLTYALNQPNFTLIEGDICDPSSVNNIISIYKPHECYLMAAQSHVATSFNQPSYTFQVNAVGPLYVLEAIRLYSPATRLVQASTSEMFGNNYSTTKKWNGMIPAYDIRDIIDDEDYTVTEKFQDENTSLSPNSPYAVAKVATHHLIRVYREAYGLHCSAAISFNHESSRRGENFVTRKITKWIADNLDNIAYPKFTENPIEYLKLGNIDAVRDWGYSPDFCEAFFQILQQDVPDDYVICTGESHTVREFLEEAFTYIGQDYTRFVQIDQDLYRPNEVPFLCGKYDKIKNKLGWEPKVKFKELVQIMVDSDIINHNDN